MSFPRYPKYKDSGVEWLGEVPEGWQVLRLKWLIEVLESGTSVNAVDTAATDLEFGVLKTSCVYTGIFDATENKTIFSEEIDRATCPVREGALIVSRMNTPQLVGAAGLVKGCHPNLFLPDRLWQILLRDSVPQFVHYWTRSGEYRHLLQAASSGTSSSMQNLGQDEFRSFSLPVPPSNEQQTIADFLDEETAKIDALIEEQRRLIELLKEKRQAVILDALSTESEAKTSRLDDREGSREIGWRTARLKMLAKWISKGTTPTTVGAEFTNSGIRFIKAENITKSGVSETPEFFIGEDTHDLLKRSALEPSDILVVIAGATTGKSAVMPRELLPANTNQAVSFVRLKDVKYAPFVNLWLSLKSVQDSILLNSVQSAQPNLSMEDLGNISIAVPSEHQLSDVLSYVSSSLERLDLLSCEAIRAIELLQERRSALISAAVTGKIDVRNYKPQSSEISEEMYEPA